MADMQNTVQIGMSEMVKDPDLKYTTATVYRFVRLFESKLLAAKSEKMGVHVNANGRERRCRWHHGDPAIAYRSRDMAEH